ncbi:MAG: hypothetical protein ACE5NC_09625, partial [Anaerolineae bacterium]
EFVLQAGFPTEVTSFRLSLLNLLFAIKNWRFGLVTGTLYAAFTWTPPIATPTDLLSYPASLVWMALILAGSIPFAYYADQNPRWFRWSAGLLHGAAHLASAFLISGWTANTFGGDLWPRLLVNFFGGGIAGLTILGLYLFLALNLFGAHPNYAFSSLRIQDYKHFLRLHITREGHLEIFPIGVNKIPRRADAHAKYALIEKPITINPQVIDDARNAL